MQNRKRMILFLGIAAFLLVRLVMGAMQPGTPAEEFAYIEAEPLNLQESVQQNNTIVAEIAVHVAGAVQKPGVYTLEQGKRVEDALQLAGVTDDADIDALNRAAVLTDGQKIVVPSKTETQLQPKQEMRDGLVNLNEADITQLMTLPGIGEVKAQAILDYREQHGAFQTVEEIQQVNGIGEAIYSRIKNNIKI